MVKKPKDQKPPKPPAIPQPWDELPILPNGDATPEPIFESVGEALTAWETLESNLVGVYNRLIPSRNDAALAAWGALASSASRASMIVTAASYLFDDEEPIFRKLTQIINEIGQMAGRRNNIAHGIVTRVRASMTLKDSKTRVVEGHFLIAAYYMTKKNLSPSQRMKRLQGDPETISPLAMKYAYTAGQIRASAQVFRTYVNKLAELMCELDVEIEKRWPSPERRVQELEREVEDLRTKLKAQEHQPRPQPSEG
jgi:hypothetical protein